MEPRDKIAIVTGAGSGIGRATALRLCAEGALVVAADRDSGGAQETVRLAAAAGGRCSAAEVDVADPPALERLFHDTEGAYGGIDILHNNAGMLLAPAWPEAPIEAWTRMLDVNLRAVIHGTQLAVAAMRRRGGGAIVNTASLAGLSGYPPDPVYGATKGGVVVFTLSLAPLAYSDRIRINCVCPGVTNTPMARGLAPPDQTLLGFAPAGIPMSSPDDIAAGVLQLIRDDALAGRVLKVTIKGASLEPLPKGAWRPPEA